MEIQSLDGNTLKISTKKVSIVLDASDIKSQLKDGDIALFSNKVDNMITDNKLKLSISSAGEYEVSDVLIVGIPALPYKENTEEKFSNTIYKLISDDTNLAIIGDIAPNLTDSQIEDLGQVDCLVIPVGGDDLSLDASQALKIIQKIEPSVVIPINYNDESIKTLGLEVLETTSKYKLKSSNFIEGQATKLVILEKA